MLVLAAVRSLRCIIGQSTYTDEGATAGPVQPVYTQGDYEIDYSYTNLPVNLCIEISCMRLLSGAGLRHRVRPNAQLEHQIIYKDC